jgi:CBS domain-containing protein
VGVFTQKDLLQSVALEPEDWYQLAIRERMSSPVVVAPPETPLLEASHLLKSRHIKHLPVVSEQRLVGIVTQTDITRGLIHLTPLQCVREIMSPDVASVSAETTIAEAARIMWPENISCVVVMHRSDALGIVSQTDILIRVILPRKDPVHTPVSEVMSSPVLPVPPHYSVFTASRIMDQMHIHRLIVRDGKRVCGIVSQTDILQAIEQRLAEEQEHRRFPICSDLPMFALDLQGVVTYANEACLGLLDIAAPEQMVGTTFSDTRFWSSSEDRQRLLGVLGDGRSDLLELVVTTGAGTIKRIIVLLGGARDADGRTIGWQGTAWRLAGRETASHTRCESEPDNSCMYAPLSA